MKKDKVFYAFVVIILSLILGAYSNHFNNPFEFDDGHTIVINNAIRSLKNIPQFFTDARTFSTLPANQVYRPGLTTLNAIDYWIGGKPEPDPFYYHVSIFISYLVLCILLYFLFLAIFKQTIDHPWNKYFALFAAGFFGLHTANAETINYIIARSDSFSTLMLTLALVIYIYKPEWRKKLIYLIPVLLGFFVKEPTIMVGPILFVYLMLFNEQLSIPDWFSKRGLDGGFSILKAFIPLIILTILLFIMSSVMHSDTFYPSSTPRIYYMLTQPFVILHYFNNFILPIDLSIDTDWMPVKSLTDYRVWVGAAFIIALIITSVYCSTKKRLKPISFGIMWFLLALLPTSITSLAEVMNDHRTFFPYIGLVIAFTWMFALVMFKLEKRLENNSGLKYGCLLFFLCILCAHAYGVRKRNQVWSSSEFLWHDVVVNNPKNGRGLMNYGSILMSKGNFITSLGYFERAKKLMPNYSSVYLNLAINKYETDGTKEEVEEYFEKAINLYNDGPESYYYYAHWLILQNRSQYALNVLNRGLLKSKDHIANKALQKELQALIEKERKEILIAEQDAINLPTAAGFTKLSLLYYKNEEYERSILTANKALQSDPNDTTSYNIICAAQNVLGDFDDAIETCEKAINLQPENQFAKNKLRDIKNRQAKVDSVLTILRMQPTAAHFVSLSLVYFNLGCYKKCIEAAEKAIHYDKKNYMAYNNISSAYTMLRQWNKAIEYGEKGLKINPNSQLLNDNLNTAKQGKKADEFQY